MISGCVVDKKISKKLIAEQEMSNKHLSLFLMMNKWVRINQEGKKISLYFEKNGYKKIAIYGMSYAGKTLLNELKETAIQVRYAIDKNLCNSEGGVTICSIEDNLEDVDAIIVTAITYFDEIRDELEDKVQCPIISLESVIYET